MSERRYREVPGYVWCDHHGSIHVDDPDPFDEGVNCRWGHHTVCRLTDEEVD